MRKFGLEKKMLLAAGVAALGLVFTSIPVFAASWRVQSYAYGDSYLDGQTIVTDFSGNELYNFSGTQRLDSEYQYSSTANQDVSFDRSFRQSGQPEDSTGDTYTASWAAYSSTGYGKNKVRASMTGVLNNGTYEETINNPVTGNTISLSTSESRYVYGTSQWEELFLITPKNKNLIGTQASIKMYVHLDGTLTGDTSSFGYNLSNFDWTSVASDYANGETTVNENLIGTFTFIYGEPLYLQSRLYAQVYGIGSVDMSHTAEVTGIDIPEGAKIKFFSGASSTAYGTLQGGDGYGEYGTGTSPVPVPAAAWLLGSGLLGLIGLRRKGSASGESVNIVE
jgi:hypothetical protein